MKKRYLLLLFLVVFLFPFQCFASPRVYDRTKEDYRVPSNVVVDFDTIPDIMKTPSVESSEKIYDFIDILTEEERTELFQLMDDYIRSTGNDSIIVLTDNIEDFELSDYAYHFYDYNYFKHDGIILVIYFEGDNIHLFMGNSGSDVSRVFKVYTDDTIHEILEYITKKHVANKEYFEMCKDYVIITYELYHRSYKTFNLRDLDFQWMELIIMSFAFTFIIVVLLITKYNVKSKKNRTIKNSVNNTNMIIKTEYDKPVDSTK